MKWQECNTALTSWYLYILQYCTNIWFLDSYWHYNSTVTHQKWNFNVKSLHLFEDCSNSIIL